ncbi:S-methyl-5-thioribose-1-phosphate isomerase, partial [Candidatus Entotheonella serta]
MESVINAIEIHQDQVRLLDQRRLPLVEEYVACRSYEETAQAITDMVVR